MEAVTHYLTKDSTFPVIFTGTQCNAPIDTRVLHSFMSEDFYQQLVPPQIKQIFHLSLASASINTLSPLGTITCPLNPAGHSFEPDSIVWKNLTKSLIFGPRFYAKALHCLKMLKKQINDYLFNTRMSWYTISYL